MAISIFYNRLTMLKYDEEKRKILKERAHRLAVEKVEQQEKDTTNCLIFKLESEKYGIESRYVNKVILLQDLTPLTGMPPHLIGIMNIRGRIIPVISLKMIFGIPDSKSVSSNHVIVIQVGEAVFGICADEILGLLEVLTENIQNSLPTLTGIRVAYLKGVSREGIVLLDPEKMASNANLFKSVT